MRAFWGIARLDFAVCLRSPWALAAAIIPPAGMLLLVKVLTVAVTVQPVALVVEGHGPLASEVAAAIVADRESYEIEDADELDEMTKARAQRLLDEQQVAAVIDIPKGFDKAVARGHAVVNYTLNNVDIDFADDIRRSIDRTVAQFDAPQLGTSVEGQAGAAGLIVPNPYRVDLAETDLRDADVPFDRYQTLPVLLLLVLSLGLLGGSLLGSRDRERGTAEFLRLTPLRPGAFIAGRLVATLGINLAITLPVTLYLFLDGKIDPPPGHWPPFLAVLITTAVLSTALGVLLGSAFRRSTTVALAAVIVSSYLFFLGGGFTTIAFLPDWLRALSRVVPTRYAIEGMRQSLFYPDLTGVGVDLIVLGGFSVAALLLGVLTLQRSAAR